MITFVVVQKKLNKVHHTITFIYFKYDFLFFYNIFIFICGIDILEESMNVEGKYSFYDLKINPVRVNCTSQPALISNTF